jgi:hypothetical protein
VNEKLQVHVGLAELAAELRLPVINLSGRAAAFGPAMDEAGWISGAGIAEIGFNNVVKYQ